MSIQVRGIEVGQRSPGDAILIDVDAIAFLDSLTNNIAGCCSDEEESEYYAKYNHHELAEALRSAKGLVKAIEAEHSRLRKNAKAVGSRRPHPVRTRRAS